MITKENTMKKEVGIWIDHRRAVIVTMEDEVEKVLEIQSNIEKSERTSGSRNPKSEGDAHESKAEDMRDRHFGNHLSRYYEGVVSVIHDADAIWIFGPGEAKGELEKHLINEQLGERIIGIESVDKMTGPQISAKVRDRFLR